MVTSGAHTLMSGRLNRHARVLLALACLAMVAQAAGRAQVGTGDPLPFSKSYTITGNYVVRGVDLNPKTAVKGFATGTIQMSGVPAGADVVAAFPYWETISTQPSQIAGAQFRGSALTGALSATKNLTPATASCWSAGGGSRAVYKLTKFRADVLQLLPTDAAGRPLANGLHTVRLPEAGTGNQVPQSAGASLLVVYRDPAQPLTKIVV